MTSPTSSSADAGVIGVLTPAMLEARLLYRDAMMLILDKPAGLPVHGGPGGGPNLEALFEHLRFGLPRPPGLAHRLDRDTSGCLVLGRHRRALARLGRLFADGRVDKIYWAIVLGVPEPAAGRIDAALKKVTRRSGWRMVADPGGLAAVTEYRLLAAAGGLAWIEFRPRTGRTHQVRVHAALLGCPVLGDPVYGPTGAAGLPPLHLHARAVAVPLYPRRPPVTAIAPVPAHIADTLAAAGLPLPPDTVD